MLVNRLLEERTIDQLGAVVVDELHMVGEQGRGHTLELMLSKLCYHTQKGFKVEAKEHEVRRAMFGRR